MNTQLLLSIGMIVGWIGLLVFFILWMRLRAIRSDSKYNKEAIYGIRKELRFVHDNLKERLGEVRQELYSLFISIDKLLERL